MDTVHSSDRYVHCYIFMCIYDIGVSPVDAHGMYWPVNLFDDCPKIRNVLYIVGACCCRQLPAGRAG